MPHRLTVRQNLTVFAELYAVPHVEERIARLAHDLAFADLLDRPAGQLSAGQKTRVALAKALLNEPAILLLDEPTASLDPDTADWVRTHLENYRRGRQATILLASHNMNEVERLCDRVIMLKEGKIVGDDSPAGLIERFGRKNLEEVFPRSRARPATSPPTRLPISATGSAHGFESRFARIRDELFRRPCRARW